MKHFTDLPSQIISVSTSNPGDVATTAAARDWCRSNRRGQGESIQELGLQRKPYLMILPCLEI
jgi:hypothetical protein